MSTTIAYQRSRAVEYAKKWARGRNPAYPSFDQLGGDCTNFISQCLYAGSGIWNETPDTGWYLRSLNDRAAAWSGVEYLAKFLLRDGGPGPYAKRCSWQDLKPGDVVQLGNHERFYHSLLVVQTGKTFGDLLIATHTFDTLNRRLDSYVFHRLRCLTIVGVRTG
jgi:hypothetical protein